MFGRIDPFERPGAADFALRFAAPLLTFQTAQPRRAFRLLITPMRRGYPLAKGLTHKTGRRPPSGALWREGMIRAGEEERARIAHVPMKMPAGSETYALLKELLPCAKNEVSEGGSGTFASARSAALCVRWLRAKPEHSAHSRR